MGDNLSQQQRSYCMSRVRSADTGIEVAVRSGLHRRGMRFRKNIKGLPGKPDIAFTRMKVVVFIDGDFWHGYEFSEWKQKMTGFWQKKIATNMERDEKNSATLRRSGWRVVRLWEHDVRADLEGCLDRIAAAVRGKSTVSDAVCEEVE